ncbi:MAG TPA: hypothetical protein VIH86_17100 [Puia sp.]
MLNVPYPSNECPFIFIQDSGKYKQFTVNPIDYHGGKLSYQDHTGVKVVYFYTDSSYLPFDFLNIRSVLITLH